MDLNSFIGETKEKGTYKITFMLGNEKIKRFLSAYSKENAKHQLEQDLKKEHPGKKIIISEVKLIEKKKEDDENGNNMRT